jgi:hypothetical protein
MRDQSSVDADAAAKQATAQPSTAEQSTAEQSASALAGELQTQAAEPPGPTGPAGTLRDPGSQASPAARGRRAAAAAAWAVGAAIIFFLFLRISVTKWVDSDGANNALQAYDMLHGHILLHGWIIGDATYYTFELPLIAIIEIFFGLHNLTMFVAEAAIYLIVAAWAVAIAVTDSRGAARAVRGAIVVAVLAAPALISSDMWIPLGIPDHTGTTVFLLISCLLVDRAPNRRFTAPLVCLILCAGQIGDVTTRFVAVPAIALVCAYQVVATRRLRSGDGANLLAAILSFPLSLGVRAAMLHFGAYLQVAPRTTLAPVSLWGKNASYTWGAIRMVFGAQGGPNAAPAGNGVIFGYGCLVIAALGILRVLWRWRSARRGEQVLLAAIAANLGVYILSTLPGPASPHDIIAILPSAAVLAARAIVPRRITSRVMAGVATVFAAAAALLPLAASATRPIPPGSNIAPLAAWLQAHGLRYGLGGYWDGSSVTLETGGQVQISTIHMFHGVNGPQLALYPWENNSLWFDPTKHYANFVVINLVNPDNISTGAARVLGKPTSTSYVGGWEILTYNQNVLTYIKPGPMRATT